MRKQRGSQAERVVSVLAIFYWCAALSKTHAIFEAYLLVAVSGLAGCIWKWCCRPEKEEKREALAGRLCSGLLSFAVVLANNDLFQRSGAGAFEWMEKLVSLVLMFLGGYAAFRGITGWIGWNVKRKAPRREISKKERRTVFLGAWAGIMGVYLLFFYGALYPGFWSPDTRNQFDQCLTGVYNNHQPFYHTQLLRLFLSIGKDFNTGVGLYNLFSVLFMSFSFAYVVYTVYQYSGSRLLAAGIFLWYALSPVHIIYSVTVWKNVLIGGAAALFVTSTFRMHKRLEGWPLADLIVYILSAAMMCLMLSNGYLATAAAWVLMMIFFRKEKRTMAVLLAVVLCGSFILKHPVLKAMNVVPADTVESLSIPVQQIARVVVNGRELTQEQRDLLEQVVDVDGIPGRYSEFISDPIKNMVRARGNQEYLTAHKWEYLKLYVQLGLRYPSVYLSAWVEQTKGYWNGGYEYMRWQTPEKKSSDVKYGLYHSAKSETVFQLLEDDIQLQDSPLLKPFLCIGLYTWMLVLCVYAAFVRRDRQAGFTAVLPAMIVGTLLVATPVFCEFRYVYGEIASMPMVIAACLLPEKK